MPTFEAAIFNQTVRRLLSAGRENNTGWSDTWADLRYVQYKAMSEEQARGLAERDYPQREGFVVVAVERLRYEP